MRKFIDNMRVGTLFLSNVGLRTWYNLLFIYYLNTIDRALNLYRMWYNLLFIYYLNSIKKASNEYRSYIDTHRTHIDIYGIESIYKYN